MYKCEKCGNESSKWIGKCPGCQEWNTFVEITEVKKNTKSKTKGDAIETHKLGIIGNEEKGRIKFKSEELNNVLGGGLTQGSLILLSGEPGIGKSTLALQMTDWYSTDGRESLYISSEENISQISQRASRLGIDNKFINVINSGFLEDIIETIKKTNINFIVIDSISIISSSDLTSGSGSISQIKYISEMLMQTAKSLKKSIVIIGHITKDGTIGGPKLLEHLVDTVLYIEGSRYENYRILRTFKNRFGPTDEVGLFTMTEKGLKDIKNPGIEFINGSESNLSGSALTIINEGTRPILIEIEALTTYTKFGYPKRSVRGINSGKLDLIIAIISKFTETKLDSYDVYLNIARGLQSSEPGIDLAMIASIISSKKGKPLGKKIFIGEVSLTGIVKNVMQIEKRVNEAIKLGFKTIILPINSVELNKFKEKTEIIEIKNIKEIEKLI